MSTTIDLSSLQQLSDLFGLLNAGKHINRVSDPAQWAELDRERESYTRLFGSLGFDLRIDERGFAWFNTRESSPTVSKNTRRLALLFMLIFEVQADAGHYLGRFAEWTVDAPLLQSVVEKHRLLLEAEGMASVTDMEDILKIARIYGFAVDEGAYWRLLPAVYRYLDRFEELGSMKVTDTTGDEWMPATEDETIAEEEE